MLIKAKELIDKKKYDEAIHLLHSLLDADDKNAEIYQELGRAYIGKKDFSLGKEYSAKAIELNPALTIPYIKLAEIKILQKSDYLECYKLAETAFNQEPDLDSALACYGTASYLIGNIDQGVTSLEKARNASPDKSYIRHNLAIAYTLANKYDLAYHEFRMANQLEPSWQARYMVLSSYFSQTKVSKYLSAIYWIMGILVIISVVLHFSFLLLIPIFYFLFIALANLFGLFFLSMNWKILFRTMIGALFGGLLIHLFYLMGR